MDCCEKIVEQVKKVTKQAGQIVEGYSNLVKGKRFEFTNERIIICQKCKKNYWVGKKLFCSICKCLIPAKARVEENTCPEKKWRK